MKQWNLFNNIKILRYRLQALTRFWFLGYFNSHSTFMHWKFKANRQNSYWQSKSTDQLLLTPCRIKKELAIKPLRCEIKCNHWPIFEVALGNGWKGEKHAEMLELDRNWKISWEIVELHNLTVLIGNCIPHRDWWDLQQLRRTLHNYSGHKGLMGLSRGLFGSCGKPQGFVRLAWIM